MKSFILFLILSGNLFTSLSAESLAHSKKILPFIILEDDMRGYSNDSRWDSSILQGETTLLVYFDPDERKGGEKFMPTLESFEKDLDFTRFQIILIVNVKATWIPKFLIKSTINSQAKAHPNRSYVLDYNSVLVNNWGLNDDAYNTLVIDEEGRIIYSHTGEWNEEELVTIDSLVRLHTGYNQP